MALFKKKEEEGSANNIPVSQILDMRSRGMNNTQIANQLRMEGFSITQIRDGFSQAEIKGAVGGGAMARDEEMEGIEELDMGDLPEIPEHPFNEAPAPRAQQPAYPEAQRMMPPPIPQRAPTTGSVITEVQRVIEEIIEEKWDEVEDKLNALDVWKTKIDERVDGVSLRIKEITDRVDGFSKAMMGKNEEYQSTMEEVGTQMEAVEKLMGKLIPSLAEEIKELRNVVDKLKKK